MKKCQTSFKWSVFHATNREIFGIFTLQNERQSNVSIRAYKIGHFQKVESECLLRKS
jgi:hypothetical protein